MEGQQHVHKRFFLSSRKLRNESFLFCPITLTCVNDQKWNPTRRPLKPRRSVNRLAPSAARKQQRERQAPYTRIRAAGWTDRNNPVSIVYTNSQFRQIPKYHSGEWLRWADQKNINAVSKTDIWPDACGRDLIKRKRFYEKKTKSARTIYFSG